LFVVATVVGAAELEGGEVIVVGDPERTDLVYGFV
jgi:hypothetical protein